MPVLRRFVHGHHPRVLLLAVSDRLIGTGITVGVVAVAAAAVHVYAGIRAQDRASAFHLRRATRYVALIVLLVALAGIWHVFAGRIGVVVGLFAAGLGLALQEVVASLFGWGSILAGRIFRVGDRIAMGGVEGDVIDLTPLRTMMLEMGQPPTLGSNTVDDVSTPSWVRGRQYTGRIVAIANNAVFAGPVYNYSAAFEFIWDELTMPVSYRSDWREAERIMLEEVESVSSSSEAQEAMDAMTKRYPVPRTEIEPKVFVRATDNWMELAARFVVPVRTTRTVKSELAKRIRDRFDEAGIEISSTTNEQFVRFPAGFPADADDSAGAHVAAEDARPA